MSKRSEIEIATSVILWLRRNGWKVYQEVPLYGSLIDIVAERDGILWGIEVKTSFSATLKQQVKRIVHFVHRTSIAIPYPKRRKQSHRIHTGIPGSEYYKEIGVLYVDEIGTVEEILVPTEGMSRSSLFNRIIKNIEHMEEVPPGIAGQPSKDRDSPFTRTCALLRDYIKEHPSCTLKEAVENIDHHYSSFSSAYGSLGKWINAGKVKGLSRDKARGGLKYEL